MTGLDVVVVTGRTRDNSDATRMERGTETNCGKGGGWATAKERYMIIARATSLAQIATTHVYGMRQLCALSIHTCE